MLVELRLIRKSAQRIALVVFLALVDISCNLRLLLVDDGRGLRKDERRWLRRWKLMRSGRRRPGGRVGRRVNRIKGEVEINAFSVGVREGKGRN